MQFPVCIEYENDDVAIGIQVPDIPGAITAGDTFEDAYAAAIEISHILLREIAAAGKPLPRPSSVLVLRDNPDFAGMGWGMLDIDLAPYLGKTEKVNVTLPGFVIQQVDRYVRDHNIKSRSAFLADAALAKLGH